MKYLILIVVLLTAGCASTYQDTTVQNIHTDLLSKFTSVAQWDSLINFKDAGS